MYYCQEEIRLLRQKLKEMEQNSKLTDDSRENVRLQQQIVQLQQQLEQVTNKYHLNSRLKFIAISNVRFVTFYIVTLFYCILIF